MNEKTCNNELNNIDIEDLIRLTNITKGPLLKRMEEIKKSLVFHSLSFLPDEKSFKVSDLSNKLYKMAKII